MKLEGVLVSVNCGDILAKTLPLNRPHLDSLTVVTKHDDIETQEVCAKYDTKCVTTHAFGPNGGFCKGAGINVGLNTLDLDGWVMHLDADTVLPIHARKLLEKRVLDPTCIYGAHRLDLVGIDAFNGHIEGRRLQEPPRTFGTDGWWLNTIVVVFHEYGGWLPCGFLQIFNPDGSGIRLYPEDRITAEPAHAGNTDLQFAGQWPMEQRILMPEFLVGHFQTEQIGSGADWHGRKTRRVGATEAPAHHGRPWNVRPPSIWFPQTYAAHIPRVGESLTLEPGEWTGDTPLTFSYAWERAPRKRDFDDFDPIAGATATQYVVTSEDVGQKMRVRVKVSNERGGATAYSRVTATVEP